MRLTLRAAVSVACVLALAPSASAHLSGGTVEKQVGDYLVDVGYSTFILEPEVETAFSFLLVSKPGTLDWDYVPYTRATVDIVAPDGTRRSETMDVEPPVVAFLAHTFPEAGTYTMDLSYYSGSTLIVRTDIALEVRNAGLPARMAPAQMAAAIIALMSVGLTLTVLWARRRAQQEDRPSA